MARTALPVPSGITDILIVTCSIFTSATSCQELLDRLVIVFNAFSADPARNNVRGAAEISAENSPVTVRVIPPAEDLIIVNHVMRLLAK